MVLVRKTEPERASEDPVSAPIADTKNPIREVPPAFSRDVQNVIKHW